MVRKEKRTPKEKAARYCAFQERSQHQVRQKLFEYGLHGDEVENIIVELISENFINEERFACAYVSGKHKVNKWGRIKIRQGLKSHNISDYCMRKGFDEINEDHYLNTLGELVDKYISKLSDKDAYIRKQKTARYLIGKGYEPELVYETINTYLSD